MTKILIIDINTTGFDKNKDKIIEFGAALCDWKKKKPVYIISENIQYDEEIDPVVTDRTGIETYMVKTPYAVPLKTACFFLNKIAQEAHYYCIHDNPFDFILPAMKELGMKLPNKPIIESRTDLPVEVTHKSLELNHLLSEYGLINPLPHRAISNCLSLFQLMQKFKLKEIIKLQQSEMITIKGMVGYVGKDKARELGFQWDAPTKRWLLELKKCRFATMKYKKVFPFPVRVEYEIPF